MISLFFGLPGAGKTTVLASLALKLQKQKVGFPPKKKYDHIYTNVHCTINGVTYVDNECIGKYELENCAILIDEATLYANDRDWKNFSGDRLAYFLEHRHHRADIWLFSQQWDGVDKKIRVITDRVFYVYKSFLTRGFISKYYRIPYGIIIPDGKKTGNSEKLGEIIQGYSKPPLIVRIFAKRVFRPKYYKYFDSWECERLPELPARYQAYIGKK